MKRVSQSRPGFARHGPEVLQAMRKVRDDSTWNQLTFDQLDALESWLFDEKLGYAETLARVQQEFGIKASIAGLSRFYRRRARERQLQEVTLAGLEARVVNGLPFTPDQLRTAVGKVVGTAALRLAREQPDQVETLMALARLMQEGEEIAIRRGRLRLAERQFDYTAAAVQEELPKLRACMNAVETDPDLTHDQKLERVREILFGTGQKEAGKPPPPLAEVRVVE